MLLSIASMLLKNNIYREIKLSVLLVFQEQDIIKPSQTVNTCGHIVLFYLVKYCTYFIYTS